MTEQLWDEISEDLQKIVTKHPVKISNDEWRGFVDACYDFIMEHLIEPCVCGSFDLEHDRERCEAAYAMELQEDARVSGMYD